MRNEARASVSVSVYTDLIGNFRSADLGMMEGEGVGKKDGYRDSLSVFFQKVFWAARQGGIIKGSMGKERNLYGAICHQRGDKAK